VTTSRVELGFTEVPTARELELVEDRERPWVVWGRGDAGELVLIALDDPAPANPTVHVVRRVGKRVVRSKQRLDAWLT